MAVGVFGVVDQGDRQKRPTQPGDRGGVRLFGQNPSPLERGRVAPIRESF